MPDQIIVTSNGRTTIRPTGPVGPPGPPGPPGVTNVLPVRHGVVPIFAEETTIEGFDALLFDLSEAGDAEYVVLPVMTEEPSPNIVIRMPSSPPTSHSQMFRVRLDISSVSNFQLFLDLGPVLVPEQTPFDQITREGVIELDIYPYPGEFFGAPGEFLWMPGSVRTYEGRRGAITLDTVPAGVGFAIVNLYGIGAVREVVGVDVDTLTKLTVTIPNTPFESFYFRLANAEDLVSILISVQSLGGGPDTQYTIPLPSGAEIEPGVVLVKVLPSPDPSAPYMIVGGV